MALMPADKLLQYAYWLLSFPEAAARIHGQHARGRISIGSPYQPESAPDGTARSSDVAIGKNFTEAIVFAKRAIHRLDNSDAGTQETAWTALAFSYALEESQQDILPALSLFRRAYKASTETNNNISSTNYDKQSASRCGETACHLLLSIAHSNPRDAAASAISSLSGLSDILTAAKCRTDASYDNVAISEPPPAQAHSPFHPSIDSASCQGCVLSLCGFVLGSLLRCTTTCPEACRREARSLAALLRNLPVSTAVNTEKATSSPPAATLVGSTPLLVSLGPTSQGGRNIIGISNNNSRNSSSVSSPPSSSHLNVLVEGDSAITSKPSRFTLVVQKAASALEQALESTPPSRAHTCGRTPLRPASLCSLHKALDTAFRLLSDHLVTSSASDAAVSQSTSGQIAVGRGMVLGSSSGAGPCGVGGGSGRALWRALCGSDGGDSSRTRSSSSRSSISSAKEEEDDEDEGGRGKPGRRSSNGVRWWTVSGVGGGAFDATGRLEECAAGVGGRTAMRADDDDDDEGAISPPRFQQQQEEQEKQQGWQYSVHMQQAYAPIAVASATRITEKPVTTLALVNLRPCTAAAEKVKSPCTAHISDLMAAIDKLESTHATLLQPLYGNTAASVCPSAVLFPRPNANYGCTPNRQVALSTASNLQNPKSNCDWDADRIRHQRRSSVTGASQIGPLEQRTATAVQLAVPSVHIGNRSGHTTTPGPSSHSYGAATNASPLDGALLSVVTYLATAGRPMGQRVASDDSGGEGDGGGSGTETQLAKLLRKATCTAAAAASIFLSSSPLQAATQSPPSTTTPHTQSNVRPPVEVGAAPVTSLPPSQDQETTTSTHDGESPFLRTLAITPDWLAGQTCTAAARTNPNDSAAAVRAQHSATPASCAGTEPNATSQTSSTAAAFETNGSTAAVQIASRPDVDHDLRFRKDGAGVTSAGDSRPSAGATGDQRGGGILAMAATATVARSGGGGGLMTRGGTADYYIIATSNRTGREGPITATAARNAAANNRGGAAARGAAGVIGRGKHPHRASPSSNVASSSTSTSPSHAATAPQTQETSWQAAAAAAAAASRAAAAAGAWRSANRPRSDHSGMYSSGCSSPGGARRSISSGAGMTVGAAGLLDPGAAVYLAAAAAGADAD